MEEIIRIDAKKVNKAIKIITESFKRNKIDPFVGAAALGYVLMALEKKHGIKTERYRTQSEKDLN
jgi:hypothetical protein